MNRKTLLLVLLMASAFNAKAELDELPEIEAEIDAEYAVYQGPNIVPASADTEVLNSAPINIDGYVQEEAPQDPELVEIQKEIQRQKKEVVLNKQKANGFKQLSKSTEVLTETTVEMLEEKKAVQEQIAEYNAKVKCLQTDKPGPECDKYIKRR